MGEAGVVPLAQVVAELAESGAHECDRPLFALVNRSLNFLGYRASVTGFNAGNVMFLIERAK